MLVEPGLEGARAVVRLAVPGHGNQTRPVPQVEARAPRQFVAVEPGEAHVDERDAGHLRQDPRQPLGAVGRPFDRISVEHQELGQGLPNVDVVLDENDPDAFVHGGHRRGARTSCRIGP